MNRKWWTLTEDRAQRRDARGDAGLARIVLPLVLLGALALLVGAVAAVPYLLARGAVRLLRR